MKYAHADDTEEMTRGVSNVIRYNHREAMPLLDVEEPFEYSDVDSISHRLWSKLASVGAIHKTDDYTTNSRTRVLDPRARKRLEEYREKADNHPDGTKVCPHCLTIGFRNLPGADYECTNPRCGKEFETFHEVGSA